ncbi:putative isomerase YbhE [Massarina eburnea CBS 473.64]|uniref:Putative isomerase YbhE n=1 Tax=Massarina eburnea CBS 473.64 TaxID=1395130 RepID=A0A6A6SB58_9PLEO|nr:putative isomerase YbhE [Massarina eburnea CBS 473.64]
MLSSSSILVPLFASFATAANLWATHYSGTANWLTFNGSSLKLTTQSKTNNLMPSWITFDAPGKALYIPDENYNSATGTLVSFSVGANGAITQTGKATTPKSAVATTLYGGSDGKGFIVNAHYDASTLTTFKLPLNNGQPLQTLRFTMASKGPNSRQDVPHPHHAFTDPTGAFVLVPDLGADLIRIFSIDSSSGNLTECGAGKAPAGAGPRHGTFWAPAGANSRISRVPAGLILFVANELGNSISGYTVAYPSGSGGCLSLTVKQTLNPYQNGGAAPKGTKVAEVRTKDNFAYIANRNDKKYGAKEDSITQYSIASDGTLTWTDVTSSYSWYPRTFDINKAGDYVAIGGQTTANVAIVKRDTTTGKLGPKVADLRIGTTGTAENEDGILTTANQTRELQSPFEYSKHSMKTDHYKNLCLEQAALSPLCYRHGCIVVRGGKVIGQGFNDHRAGFSGGALKNGRLPVRSDGAALSELKKRHKPKRELKDPPENHVTSTLASSENMSGGGGALANTPLSMHSEMMAIHSALSASSTMASTSVSSKKPYFKLSGDSKRKARLRRDAVKAYVETACKAAFAQSPTEKHFVKEEKENVAAPLGKSLEKHRMKNKKVHREVASQYTGQQHHINKRRQSARKLPMSGTITASCHCTFPNDKPSTSYSSDTSVSTKGSRKPPISEISKSCKKPMLVPKGNARSSHTIADRTKHPRLNGADLYVARLGWQTTNTNTDSHSNKPNPSHAITKPPSPPHKPPTGSLHDELLNPHPPPAPTPPPPTPPEKHPSVLVSRPCYRCISYMHSVGIKRVFWTTDSGEWECAKVRDLVDALDSLGKGESVDGVAAALGRVFVTKHEVLMVRRGLGGDG